MARKGFPESLRPPRAAALRERGQGGRRRGARAVLLAPRATTSCPTRRSPCAGPTCSSSRASTCCSRPGPGHRLAVSDLFDFTIYVDARTSDIARWYEERFLQAAARRVREPALVLPPLREPHRDRGAPPRTRDLALDQRAEPAAEHPADAVAGVARAAQERRPHRLERAAAQALNGARRHGARDADVARDRHPARCVRRVRRSRTTSASAAACRSAVSWSAASTMTRTIGSVPDGRSSTRPESPSSASTAATAAAISASSCSAWWSTPRTLTSTCG